jgi:hypothetical protein
VDGVFAARYFGYFEAFCVFLFGASLHFVFGSKWSIDFRHAARVSFTFMKQGNVELLRGGYSKLALLVSLKFAS